MEVTKHIRTQHTSFTKKSNERKNRLKHINECIMKIKTERVLTIQQSILINYHSRNRKSSPLGNVYNVEFVVRINELLNCRENEWGNELNLFIDHWVVYRKVLDRRTPATLKMRLSKSWPLTPRR